MILLDPDLEPDPAPKATSVKRVGASGAKLKSKGISRPKTSRSVRLPSARTLGSFLTAAQAAVRLKGQVTVLLTTDAAIKKLNRQFRGKNKATDVLSFPASGLGGIAGDLAISVTTALGQAAEQGHSLATEIKVLVLHGLLHLAGFDHEVDDGKMARRERVLRAKLGLPSGLIERAGFPTHSPEFQDAGSSTPLRSAQNDRMDGARGFGARSARLKSRPFKTSAKAERDDIVPHLVSVTTKAERL